MKSQNVHRQDVHIGFECLQCGTPHMLTMQGLKLEAPTPTEPANYAGHKRFMCVSYSDNANSFGLYGHIMVAEDGESWEVGRTRAGGAHKPWGLNELVDVRLLLTEPKASQAARPDWASLGGEIPRRYRNCPRTLLVNLNFNR